MKRAKPSFVLSEERDPRDSHIGFALQFRPWIWILIAVRIAHPYFVVQTLGVKGSAVESRIRRPGIQTCVCTEGVSSDHQFGPSARRRIGVHPNVPVQSDRKEIPVRAGADRVRSE